MSFEAISSKERRRPVQDLVLRLQHGEWIGYRGRRGVFGGRLRPRGWGLTVEPGHICSGFGFLAEPLLFRHAGQQAGPTCRTRPMPRDCLSWLTVMQEPLHVGPGQARAVGPADWWRPRCLALVRAVEERSAVTDEIILTTWP
jgi:hypothetical protein